MDVETGNPGLLVVLERSPGCSSLPWRKLACPVGPRCPEPNVFFFFGSDGFCWNRPVSVKDEADVWLTCSSSGWLWCFLGRWLDQLPGWRTICGWSGRKKKERRKRNSPRTNGQVEDLGDFTTEPHSAGVLMSGVDLRLQTVHSEGNGTGIPVKLLSKSFTKMTYSIQSQHWNNSKVDTDLRPLEVEAGETVLLALQTKDIQRSPR